MYVCRPAGAVVASEMSRSKMSISVCAVPASAPLSAWGANAWCACLSSVGSAPACVRVLGWGWGMGFHTQSSVENVRVKIG